MFGLEKSHKWESKEIKVALNLGLIEEDCNPNLDRNKPAIWVWHTSHPEGLLMKPCEVCGYKYGSAWLREEVPDEVLRFLRGLPGTDMEPAWI